MKDGKVLDLALEVHEDTVLEVLALEEGLAVNGAIVEAGEAEVPH